MSDHKEKCPVCSKKGSFYLGKVSDYIAGHRRNDGTEIHRVRIEVARSLQEEFLTHYDSGDEIAFFVMPSKELHRMIDIQDADEVLSVEQSPRTNKPGEKK